MIGTAWTPEEIETLRELRAVRGWNFPAIARELQRTAPAVRKKAEALEITLPPTKKMGSPRDDLALREAFMAGVPALHAAKALGIQKRAVHKCYAIFGQQITAANTDYVHAGGYLGAKEMACIAAPICGVSARAVFSRSRIRSAVLARMAIARALRDRGVSTPVISRMLGRNDHTPVSRGLKRFDAYASAYPRLLQAYEAIKEAECAALVRLAA